MHFGRGMALAAQNRQPRRIRPEEEEEGQGEGRGSGPAPFPSFSGTCSAEAKAWQPLSGPYQCCLRWRAFGARAPHVGPWKGTRPRVGSEPWNWWVRAAASKRTCQRPSHPRLAKRALPPRVLPPPIRPFTSSGAPLTSGERQAGSGWG